MAGVPSSASGTKSITIRLPAEEFEILEKYRGDLRMDAFFSALLRMIDSGAIRSTPDWIKKKKDK
jgi:hypothetical protein